ncbi:reverse transcriptase domain-containing protein [Tanacetum coccineum]
MVEKQSGKDLKVLQTDRGGEFLSKEFVAFCDDHGIKRELTTPYSPEQNGVAERKNQRNVVLWCVLYFVGGGGRLKKVKKKSEDGEVGNKGIARLISHLNRLHFSIDERKRVLREAISTDHGLYMTAEETLKACHHSDGLVRFSKRPDDMSGYIVGISKSSNKDSEIEVIEGLALDAEHPDHVFKVPMTIVKCIPHGFRLAFS